MTEFNKGHWYRIRLHGIKRVKFIFKKHIWLNDEIFFDTPPKPYEIISSFLDNQKRYVGYMYDELKDYKFEVISSIPVEVK